MDQPDLSNSISLHPHPFRTQAESASARPSFQLPLLVEQAQSSAASAANLALSGSESKGKKEASSTGVQPNYGAAFARHAAAAAAVVTDAEVESQMTGRLPLHGNDPYGLAQKYKSAAELEAIKANTSRKRDVLPGSDSGPSFETTATATATAMGISRSSKLAKYMRPFGRKVTQARRVHGFYEAQNETIERLLKSVEEHRAEARQEQGEDHLKFQIAVWGSLVANILLTVLQLYAAISSGSLSLFTTMADAVFDPMSNVTLILTNRAVKRVDPRRFPSGKARLETVGNITFCFIMIAVSLILIAFGSKDLAEQHTELKPFHLPSVIAVCVAFGTKFSLFLYTWSIRNKYSQVRILWQDHRNDLIINGFGILTSVGGAKLMWWLDPAGAIVLSVVISVIWLRTAFTEFLLLVGVTASVEIQQLITYVCVTHSPLVRQIDTVRAYHSGPRLIAEVDIVMDPDATLQETHDVAEELQMKLESLPDVERAYVHVDYETTHKPEHFYKKDI